MSRAELAKVAPGVADPEVAARASRYIADYLRATEQFAGETVEFAVDAGQAEALVLPKPAVDMLLCILAAMTQGQGVQITPLNAELTTQQAADMLNVSRPYLIGLLERGELEYRLVGRHRRIRFDALMAYKREADARSRAAIEELTRLDQEIGTE